MLTLPEDLLITQVSEFKELILEYVQSHDIICIDDSQVKRVDTIGIQLLLAIVTHIVALKKEIQWPAQSEIIKESLHKLGVNEPILNQYLSN